MLCFKILNSIYLTHPPEGISPQKRTIFRDIFADHHAATQKFVWPNTGVGNFILLFSELNPARRFIARLRPTRT